MIENDYLKDIELFQYPLTLQKLALFLMEAYKVLSIYDLIINCRKWGLTQKNVQWSLQ